MFTKHEFNLEMFVAVRWNDDEWCVSIVRNTIPLADQSVAKVWILAQPYKSTSNFVESFLGLKDQRAHPNLR